MGRDLTHRGRYHLLDAPEEVAVASTEYRVRRVAEAVQRCKSERSSCAKVERLNPITEYGVQITEKPTKGTGWLEY